MGTQPDWQVLLCEWWGGGVQRFSGLRLPTAAANIIFGDNPPYQISDFLSIYPKFGTGIQGLLAVTVSAGIATATIAAGGIGYVVGDQLTIVQPPASGGIVQVASVDIAGAILGITLFQGGAGYSVAANLSVTGGLGQGALINITAITPLGGTGYQVGDMPTVQQSDASGGQVVVMTVGGGGAVTGLQILTPGTGYSVASGLLTAGGHGRGLQLTVNAVSPYSGVIPQQVLMMYITLASACLSQARWRAHWPMAMALYVAHFCTLWLRSEGNPGSTAGQIAISGLEMGINVSESAGDVSVGRELVTDDLSGFGSWKLTTYGTQLSTLALTVGLGPMYIY